MSQICRWHEEAGNLEEKVAVQGSRLLARTVLRWLQRMKRVKSFPDDEYLVGDKNLDVFHSNPKYYADFGAKLLIGRKIDDPVVQRDWKHWPFQVIGNIIQTPEEISAMVLSKMKETAEAYLGKTVTHAVRQATKDAGTIAGLQVLRIINEPTAAAIAYGLDKKGSESQIIVYDPGGETFEVLLLSIDDGVFEALATAGDTHLGGEDFDNRVMDHLIKQYKKQTGIDVSNNLRAMGKLKHEVEKANRTLSSQQSTRVKIESFENGNNFSETLTTRAKFKEINMNLFRKTMNPVERVLKDANLKKEDIDEYSRLFHDSELPTLG
ncbi:heat shock protein 70 family [Rhodofomes roseus]|uniref:Heat shock protein 70 family n=1 Tax=Rhodofomes roseus TaxID=34475 RepID=A0ABQ8KY72_9APHY|nr:heat shock protein 70 family [Rhodofomes roseus]KAH9844249.1 heat shock protein 70 family [Rhodofomes roseus]